MTGTLRIQNFNVQATREDKGKIFTSPLFIIGQIFPSYFRVFRKVSEGNQNRGDKFNNSGRHLIQLSLSETQVHIRLHELNSKYYHYIMYIYLLVLLS